MFQTQPQRRGHLTAPLPHTHMPPAPWLFKGGPRPATRDSDPKGDEGAWPPCRAGLLMRCIPKTNTDL